MNTNIASTVDQILNGIIEIKKGISKNCAEVLSDGVKHDKRMHDLLQSIYINIRKNLIVVYRSLAIILQWHLWQKFVKKVCIFQKYALFFYQSRI